MSPEMPTLSRHGLEQRIHLLRGRLQMFGDEPDLSRESSIRLEFFQLIESLPGFGQAPRTGQVRLSERWRGTGDYWVLEYYIYDYERFDANGRSLGLWGYHLHPIETSGPNVPHIKCEDGRARDPHFVGSAVDAHWAIDTFFQMDAEDAPIDSSGLIPIYR